MYIKKVQIDNFGKFHHKSVSFLPGLNVVYGENESGKSTVLNFLHGMLFGMEKQRGRNSAESAYDKYEPWNSGSYYAGSLEFDVSGKDFTLERNFYHKEKSVRLYNQKEQEELSVIHGDLDMLLGGVKKAFYENTYCIPQAAVITQGEFVEKLQQELANYLQGGEQGVDIARAEKILDEKRKQTEQLLRKCQQEKTDHLEKLEWEKEILEEDVREMEQKLLLMPIEGKSVKSQEKKIFKIPVIGWICCFFRWLWRKFCKKQGRESQEEISSWDILKEQLEEKQTRLSNVLEEMEEIKVTTSKEHEIGIEIAGIRLALEALERATKEGYQDSKDEIQSSVSQILSGITGGKYDRVEIGEKGKLFLYINEKQVEGYRMSRGTIEQLYLALRLGIGRYMFREEDLPILLDETFCAYDDFRLKQTLQWLATQKNQIILFTCQKRELQLLDELKIAYNSILL